jgi:uncharacterized protein (TIGR03437 family)
VVGSGAVAGQDPACFPFTGIQLITGVGQTNPRGVTGVLAADPLPQPTAPVRVTVGGEVARLVSAAAQPGTVGITKITFVIPVDINQGATSITVGVGQSSDSIAAVVK